jgi:hypothetical protein
MTASLPTGSETTSRTRGDHTLAGLFFSYEYSFFRTTIWHKSFMCYTASVKDL